MRWSTLEVAKHQYFDLLTIVGLRDRLRCPKCSAIGTYKPHGGWVDLFNEWRTGFELKLLPGVVRATSRRWMCKYCGYCRDEHGEHYGAPNGKKLVWDLVGPDSHPTPKEAVEQLCGKTWPWRG